MKKIAKETIEKFYIKISDRIPFEFITNFGIFDVNKI